MGGFWGARKNQSHRRRLRTVKHKTDLKHLIKFYFLSSLLFINNENSLQGHCIFEESRILRYCHMCVKQGTIIELNVGHLAIVKMKGSARNYFY